MKVLIVLAHPERKSFNGGLVDVAIQQLEMAGHAIDVDDLYADQFDPVERAKHYAHHAFDDDYFYPSMNRGLTTSKTRCLWMFSGSWRGWSGQIW